MQDIDVTKLLPLYIKQVFRRIHITKEIQITIYYVKGCEQAYDALRDLVPFAQINEREKQPCANVTFSKVAGFSLQLK